MRAAPRRPPPVVATPRRPLPAVVAVVLLLAAGVAILATYRDYGVTWDEGLQATYGERVLGYFRSGMRYEQASELLNLRYYGPLFETVAALGYQGRPEARWERRHLAIALTGWIALVALMALARRVPDAGGSRLAFAPGWLAPLAGLALVAQPRFWGHQFNNSKDVPFAAAFTVAVAALAGIAARGLSPGRAVVAGIGVGLAAAVRPGGWPLLAVLLVAAFAAAAARGPGGLREEVAGGLREEVAGGRRGAGVAAARTGGWAFAALVVSWLVMVAPWPWAHEAPLRHPVEAMLQAGAFDVAYPVLFAGEVVSSDALPLRYLPTFLAIATPVPVVVLALVGLLRGVGLQRRAPRSASAAVLGLVQLWLLLPLSAYVLLRPNAYDGLRHFLFLLPALALLAALGVEGLAAAVPGGRARRAVVAGCVLGLVASVASGARLHPYQASYFNLLPGGLAGAEGRYETDYWTASYKEAMEWVRSQAGGRPLRVLVAANPTSLPSASAYAGAHVRLAHTFGVGRPGALPDGIDFYVATYRYGLAGNFPEAPVVHRVGRDGAIFAVVKGR